MALARFTNLFPSAKFSIKIFMTVTFTFRMGQGQMYVSIESLYMTSYLIVIVTFPLPVTISEIIENKIKWQQFDLENEGPSEIGENWTYTISLEINDPLCAVAFLHNLSYPATYLWKR